MQRFRIVLEYDGTPFVGWQRQTNGPSVQQALEEALQRITGERPVVTGAGRTDAGVHALGQVADCAIEKAISANKLREALNYHLKPAPIAVLEADLVADDFSARFSASARTYLYRIVNRRPPLTLDHNRAWLVAQPLDAEAMHAAAQRLVGQHDFTTFRSAHCQAKSPVKTLDRLDVSRHGDDVEVIAHARSFLHNQVRSIVGSLKHVGEGKWQPAEIGLVLKAKDRSRCGMLAPAHGLYLLKVSYDGAPAPKPEPGSQSGR
ncbi:MAG: tRNA pseudouridine(38-40) synthase TruA [Pseudomonadota bacterium]